ncbi:MAG: M56 family metallopeptidase [Bacteroidota bacterium]
MNAIFLYLLKAAVINALMLGFYHFAIRPGLNFKLMRLVLMSAIILPLLLPLMPQPTMNTDKNPVPVYVFSLPETSASVVITPEENQDLIPLLQNSLYFGVTSLLLIGMLISVISVIRKYLKSHKKLTPFGNVLIDNTAQSPYSFFHWVFFSEKGLINPAANWLLKHEFSHVRHVHSFDRILSGLFRSFLWFSPFAHFNNKLLSEVHEYQADADAISACGDRAAYRNLMLTFSGIPGHQQITNPFSAHLKKRMIMLNNFKPGKLSFVRLLLGISLIMAVALFSAMIRPESKRYQKGTSEKRIPNDNYDQYNGMRNVSVSPVGKPVDKPDMQNDPAKKNQSSEDDVFNVVENPPQYPGGEEARIAYMQKAISYPEQAKKDKIEGTVYVTFVVEKDGKVSNAKILRGIGSGCDEVALKAVQHMPPWVPGKQRGKVVRVQYNLPVRFMLGEGEKHSTYAVPEEKKSDNSEVFTVVEQPPVFPGGEDARIAYVINNINFPSEAKSKGIQGTVYVTFVIEQDGSVSNVKVLRGVHPALDKEAVRVIQSMPSWTPGKQRGKPVRVQFNMPVKFSLGKDKNK